MPEGLLSLRRKIEEREALIAIIGLGYVGLPVACLFAEAGFRVIGVDVRPERVALINSGVSPIEGDEPGLSDLLARVIREGRLRATTDYHELAAADVLTINVETPVGEDHRPRYEALRSVCQALGGVLQTEALVIVESTIAPGTMDGLVRPLLEQSAGRQSGGGFYLGHCPERVMPGKLLANLRTVSRVVGGETPEVTSAMTELYRTVVQADLDPTDLLTAEFVKTTENAYRDVNVAFANEVAMICEAVGADVWRVRELVNKSPGRAMLLPGAGVGGHCIPKDPWLLVAALGERRSATLIPAARSINDGMVHEVARLVQASLADAGIPSSSATVAVLGYAYLENSDDTRNSPTEALLPLLERAGYQVVVHDPFVPDYAGPVLECLAQADCAVVMVAHRDYPGLDLAEVRRVMRHPIVVDARRVFDPAALRAAGIQGRTLGIGSQPLPVAV